jgi:hypothetical protein
MFNVSWDFWCYHNVLSVFPQWFPMMLLVYISQTVPNSITLYHISLGQKIAIITCRELDQRERLQNFYLGVFIL